MKTTTHLSQILFAPFIPRLTISAIITVFGLYLMNTHNGIWDDYITPDIAFRLPTFEDIFLRLPFVTFLIGICAQKTKLSELIPSTSPPWIFSIVGWLFYGSIIWYFNTLCIQLKAGVLNSQTFLILGVTCLTVAGISAVSSTVHINIALILKWIKAFKTPFFTAVFITLVLKVFFLNVFYRFPQEDHIASLVYPVKWIIFQSIHTIISFIFSSSVLDLETLLIGTEQFTVYLHYGCSGAQGITLFLASAICFYFIIRDRVTLSARGFAATLLIGIFISSIGNVLRISTLITIGSLGYGEWAMAGFHSGAGTVLFFLIIGCYFFLIYFLFSKKTEPIFPKAYEMLTKNKAAPYIVPFMSLILVTLFFRTFTVHWDWLYPFKICLVAYVLWHYRSILKTDKPAPLSSTFFAAAGGVVIAAIWLLLPSGKNMPDISHFSSSPVALQYSWIFFKISGSVIIIPILEELFFRGYLSRVISHFNFTRIPLGVFTPFSFVGSAFAFGILHSHFWGGIIAGILFNIILIKTRSMRAVIISHAAANAVIAFVVIGGNQWQWWV